MLLIIPDNVSALSGRVFFASRAVDCHIVSFADFVISGLRIVERKRLPKKKVKTTQRSTSERT